MSVRPPQNGIDEGPDTVAFGIAALDSSLENEDVSFPTDVETLRTSLGHREIPFNAAGNTVTFATALDHAQQQQFETKRELLNELHPVFEKYRVEGGNDLLAQIRSLMPF